jgi:hypothetical protein
MEKTMRTISETEVKSRVEALLGRMSLEEKIDQFTEIALLDFMPGPDPAEMIRQGRVGAFMYVTDPKKINELQKIAVEENPSGIPLLVALDVIHGLRTIFPVPLALASCRDPSVIERAQAVAAKEARAAGILWTFGPMVEITRDARWGRIVEGAGEDPFLGSAMAAAHVRGFQGPELDAPDHLLACAKHFTVYGASEAGVATFISAYIDLNDVRDGRDAALRAFNAGLNMDMASNAYAEHLARLVEEGTVTLADAKESMGSKGVGFGDYKPTVVTVVEGIRAKLPEATIAYAPGPEIRRDIAPYYVELVPDMFPEHNKPAQTPDQASAAFQEALATARLADLVVMALGETEDMSGEYASRASLDLPGRQEELLKAVVALGKPVVLVLLNGRPLSIAWAAEHVSAILEAWEPGNEGGHAIADILFGDANPGGKLPVTFPRQASHAPSSYARNSTHMPESSALYPLRYWDGPSAPLFPFGFGLSYSSFSCTNLRVSEEQVKVGQTVEVAVEVTNCSRFTVGTWWRSCISIRSTAAMRGRCVSSKALSASRSNPLRPRRLHSISVRTSLGTGAPARGAGSRMRPLSGSGSGPTRWLHSKRTGKWPVKRGKAHEFK